MRQKTQEITDKNEIAAIVKQAKVCRLAIAEDNQPYIVPMNFGYDGTNLYFHSPKVGKKIDVLKGNNKVCFEMDIGCEIVESDSACDWAMNYKSVIGFGTASFIEDAESKKKALDVIVAQYSNKKFEYTDARVSGVVVIKIDITEISGRHN